MLGLGSIFTALNIAKQPELAENIFINSKSKSIENIYEEEDYDSTKEEDFIAEEPKSDSTEDEEEEEKGRFRPLNEVEIEGQLKVLKM